MSVLTAVVTEVANGGATHLDDLYPAFTDISWAGMSWSSLCHAVEHTENCADAAGLEERSAVLFATLCGVGVSVEYGV